MRRRCFSIEARNPCTGQVPQTQRDKACSVCFSDATPPTSQPHQDRAARARQMGRWVAPLGSYSGLFVCCASAGACTCAGRRQPLAARLWLQPWHWQGAPPVESVSCDWPAADGLVSSSGRGINLRAVPARCLCAQHWRGRERG